MKQRLQFYLLGLSPFLLAFLVWDLEFNTELPSPLEGDSTAAVPDAIVENPRLSQYNLYGKLEQLIQATELLSFNGESRLQLTQPSFSFVEETGDHWDITAQKGSFLENLNTFYLQGGVKMQRQSETLPISLFTSDMEIDLVQQSAQTQSQVRIEAPGHRISGEGFRANLNSNQFEILNKVVARHDSI